MKFQARTNDQRKLEVNWDRINQYVSHWKPGTFLDVEITRRNTGRKHPIRAYYWGVVMPIFLEAYGYDPEEANTVHKHLKIVFYGIKPDSHGVYRDKDIPALFANESDKDNTEKGRFIEWLKRKAAEQGYYIPEPNE